MDAKLFDYELPEHLIAQAPHRRRDQSRLMVLDRGADTTEIRRFRDMGDYTSPGDTLVINTTKVFKARLLGRRSSGAEVEIFLVRRLESDPLDWEALVRPTKRLKEHEEIQFGSATVTLIKHHGEGKWSVRFSSQSAQQAIVSSHGHVPLPMYIKREDTSSDIRRYQTVYAKPDQVGAVAAPTAGFHFTKPLLNALRDKGVEIAEICLHVGPGTFKPLTADRIDKHSVDPEWVNVDAAAAETINRTRERGGKLFVVGTTCVRALEAAARRGGRLEPFTGMVDLFIRPGHQFQVVDHLITNFHLPLSSLLILVSAFAGRERVLEAYREAIEHEFRFYSYGDAMLIL